jgi:Tol biopolymer transport system component
VTKTVTLTEGTNVAATVSPDHKTLVLCLQGVLYSLPASGGRARPLTDPMLDPARPDWSPKGDLITFESYSGGTFHIWVMKPDGTGIRELTTGHGDDRDPRFSPDGAKIAFSSDRAFKGSYDIWVVDVATGQLKQWTSGADDEYEPAWSPDGTELAFVSGAGAVGTSIHAIKESGGDRTLMTAPADAHVNSPAWTPDGKGIAYIQFAANKSRLMLDGRLIGMKDDVFPFPPVWIAPAELLYTANGKVVISNTATG